MGDPVEAPQADVLVEAGTGEHDVVATLGGERVVAGLPVDHLVARGVQVVEQWCPAVTEDLVGLRAALDPVVTGVTEHRVGAASGLDEVVSRPREGLIGVAPAGGEVVAQPAHDDVETGAGIDGVVALAALQHVGRR